jgi:hypothetical protein
VSPTRRGARESLARALVETVLALFSDPSVPKTMAYRNPLLLTVDVGDLLVGYSPGAEILPGVVQRTIDIWQMNSGKVFSVRFDPLHIVSFKPGHWMDLLERWQSNRLH